MAAEKREPKVWRCGVLGCGETATTTGDLPREWAQKRPPAQPSAVGSVGGQVFNVEPVAPLVALCPEHRNAPGYA